MAKMVRCLSTLSRVDLSFIKVQFTKNNIFFIGMINVSLWKMRLLVTYSRKFHSFESFCAFQRSWHELRLFPYSWVLYVFLMKSFCAYFLNEMIEWNFIIPRMNKALVKILCALSISYLYCQKINSPFRSTMYLNHYILPF